MISKWVNLSVVYLIIVALLGVLLRFIVISPIDGLNFRYLLHAHSHTAFLGWIFNALFAALIFSYIPEKANNYKLLFLLLQIAVVGMLITFPIQGYAGASISFSTLHIFLSWWFAVKFYRDSSMVDAKYKLSLSFIRWGLLFMVISAIGPFALGAIMAQGLSGTSLYNLSIYFYLHFQYNGWFTFVVFGIFFWFLEQNNISYFKKDARIFLALMTIACITGYSLSALWTKPDAWVYVIGFITVIIQLIAVFYFYKIIKSERKNLLSFFTKPVTFLLLFSFLAFLVKIVMQLASAFPIFADLAYKARNFTIGYLHIVFLGFISNFLIAWLLQSGLVKLKNVKAFWGLGIFIFGFILSEIVIFLQPIFILSGWGSLSYGNEFLATISLLMPLGLIIFYVCTSFKDRVHLE